MCLEQWDRERSDFFLINHFLMEFLLFWSNRSYFWTTYIYGECWKRIMFQRETAGLIAIGWQKDYPSVKLVKWPGARSEDGHPFWPTFQPEVCTDAVNRAIRNSLKDGEWRGKDTGGPLKKNMNISAASIIQLPVSNDSEKAILHVVQDFNRLETNFKSIKKWASSSIVSMTPCF